MLRLGVDVGGTFTDLVRVDGDGTRTFHKVPSTPADPSLAILQGLAHLLPVGAEAARADLLAHGTTVATNAVLERKGTRVGLVVTAGLGDVLPLGRQHRADLYALHPQDRPCLVPPEDVCEVQERVLPDGAVLLPLDAAEVQRVVSWAQARGVGVLAVSLLHAYANPIHESLLATALTAAGLQVSVSHEVVAEPREHERTSTTVLNAYVRPVMQAYLERLQQQMPADRLQIMRSDGGSLDPLEASRFPVHTLLSGPAAGVAGAVQAGREAGWAAL